MMYEKSFVLKDNKLLNVTLYKAKQGDKKVSNKINWISKLELDKS
jgi:hypothetical protein